MTTAAAEAAADRAREFLDHYIAHASPTSGAHPICSVESLNGRAQLTIADLTELIDAVAFTIPRGHVAVTLPRDQQGIVMFSGDTAHQFLDNGAHGDFTGWSSVERAVAVARLRAWATYLEEHP